ncbi:MAG: GspH/FimT family pseudopilin [Arenicellales bacterium]
MRGTDRATGFTLIELMITLIVAALLLVWGVPSFQRFINRTTLTSETNNWVAVLNYARNEAITRGQRVTVCRTVTPDACNGTANCTCGVSQSGSASGIPNYHSGYLIFTSAGNAQPINFIAASNQLLRTGRAESQKVTIRGNGEGDNAFSFMPNGTLDPNDVNGAGLTARHVICLVSSAADLSAAQNASNSVGRVVVISQTGRSRVDQIGSSNCAGNVADGLSE